MSARIGLSRFIAALFVLGLWSSLAPGQSYSRPQPARGKPSLTLAFEPLAPLPGAGPQVWQMVETATDQSRLYATSSTGLILSTDRGLTWQRRFSPEDPWGWQMIAVSPADPDLLLLCGWFVGLQRSDDAGATWSQPPASPHADWLWSPVFAPADANRVYVASKDGVWRSLDGGLHFEEVLSGLAAQGGWGWELAVDTNDPLHAYFTAAYLGLYETLDGGESWQHKSFPAGVRWPALGLDPQDGSRLLLGEKDIYLSTDSGATWTLVLDQSDWLDVLAIDPLDSQRFYASLRGSGLAISTDGGATWTLNGDSSLDRAGSDPRTILASRHDPALLLIGDSGGVFRSEDRGETFTRRNAGIEAFAGISDVAVDPFDASHLVVNTYASAFTSSDGGSSWTEAAGISNFHGYCLEADQVIPGRFYMPGWEGSFWRSDDGGLSFTKTGFLAAGFWKMAVHPVVGGRLFAASGGGLYRSDDGGESFVPAGLPLRWTWTVAISPVQPDLMYCVVDPILYRSEDGGSSWVEAELSPGSIVRDIVPDPVVADRAYAAVPGEGLFRSDDRGRTWVTTSTDLLLAECAVIPAFSPDVLIASDYFSKAHLSPDQGESAFEISRGLITAISSLTTSPAQVYAGTVGAGVQVLRWR
ncbi:MAG: hypothetical protein AB1486_26420 [Planctomycetota bacterium]